MAFIAHRLDKAIVAPTGRTSPLSKQSAACCNDLNEARLVVANLRLALQR